MPWQKQGGPKGRSLRELVLSWSGGENSEWMYAGRVQWCPHSGWVFPPNSSPMTIKGLPTDQPNLENYSLRPPFQVILHCVKLTVQTRHHRGTLPCSAFTWALGFWISLSSKYSIHWSISLALEEYYFLSHKCQLSGHVWNTGLKGSFLISLPKTKLYWIQK